MARPQVIFDVLNNGLGNVPLSPASVISVYGCSSAGTENEPSDPYQNPGDVVTEFGYGSGPELVANLVRSGIRATFTKVVTDVVGSTGVVTHDGTGTSVLSVSGTPLDSYEISVIPTLDGTAGTDPEPAFKISLDGGRSYTRPIRVPADRSYEGLQATTGLVFTFTAGTLVEDDEYTATSVGPIWDAVDLNDAIEAFRTGTRQEAGLHYATGAASRSTIDACAATIDSYIDRKKFARFVFEARDIDVAGGETEAEWMTALSADFSSPTLFANDRVSVAAGAERNASCLTGIQYRRSMGWSAMVRAGIVTARSSGPTFGQDLGATEDGPLVPFAQNGRGNPITEVYHDEGLVPGLDEDRFMTLTSIPGLDGYFVTNPNIMCGPSSDFTLLQYGRVMDEVCRVANIFFAGKLSTAVRLDPSSGFILEKDARSLEAGSDQAIFADVIATGNASPRTNNSYTIVARTDNISVTKTLNVTIKILPLAYLKTIEIELSFDNPATAIAA